LVIGTQGSAKPPPWAKLFYAFGVVGASGLPGAVGVTGAIGVLQLRPVVRNSGRLPPSLVNVPGVVGATGQRFSAPTRLAFWTPAGSTTTNNLPHELSPASWASAPILPTMGKQPGLWQLPIRVHRLNRLCADASRTPIKCRDLGFAKCTSTPLGMEPGSPQNFVCHPVPNSGKTFLHQ
jgi:hypothetical protein